MHPLVSLKQRMRCCDLHGIDLYIHNSHVNIIYMCKYLFVYPLIMFILKLICIYYWYKYIIYNVNT